MIEQYLELFKATAVAYSVVTEREANGDKSVTIDSNEKKVLFSIYPADSFARAGGTTPDGKNSRKLFYIYDISEPNKIDKPHEIAVKYPKANGNELRLYFNRDSGFYPVAGNKWFIFTRVGFQYPFIGFVKREIPHGLISEEQKGISFESNYALDEDDDEYLKAIASPKARQEQAEYTVTKYPRSPSLAVKAIVDANYKCQENEEHITFTSASSDKPYMEVHHLIPICYSAEFQHSIDIEPNLIVLCPNCHRKIHFSTDEQKILLLRKFHDERIGFLSECGIDISFEKLLSYYLIG